jgi:uncharacterized protein (DUF1330 family)
MSPARLNKMPVCIILKRESQLVIEDQGCKNGVDHRFCTLSEETTNQVELDTYARKAQAAAEGHNVSFLALYGKHEVLEEPTMEGAAVLRFPTIEEARRWYDSPAYQEAPKHRHVGAEYRVFIVKGAE